MTETNAVSFAAHKVWDLLTSLKLTIVCLTLLMLLVVACTLAQVQLGTVAAVNLYMRSFLVWWQVPGTSWSIAIFPGGGLGGAGADAQPGRGPGPAAGALLEEGRDLDRPRRADPALRRRVRHRRLPGGDAAGHRGGADGQLRRGAPAAGAGGHRRHRPGLGRGPLGSRGAAGRRRRGAAARLAGGAPGQAVLGERAARHARPRLPAGRQHGRRRRRPGPAAAAGLLRRPVQRAGRGGRAGGGRPQLRRLAGLRRSSAHPSSSSTRGAPIRWRCAPAASTSPTR